MIVKANVVLLILGTPEWVRKSAKNSAVLAVPGMVGLEGKADSVPRARFGKYCLEVITELFGHSKCRSRLPPTIPGSRRSDRCSPAIYLIDGKLICGWPIFSPN